MSSTPPTRPSSNHDYPTTTARGQGETDFHRALVDGLRQTLDAHFAADPFIAVLARTMVFYVPGDRRRHVRPDLMVVRGAARRDRPNYLVWEEGKGPDFVLEVTTPASRADDAEEKFRLYRDVLLVPDYFLFDPDGAALDPPLQGYHLTGGGYEPLTAVDGRLTSAALGLELAVEGRSLRFHDPKAGQPLPTPGELAARAAADRERVEMEGHWARIAAQQAEAARSLARAGQAQAEASQAQAEARARQAEAARAHDEAGRQLAAAVRAQDLAAQKQAAAAVAQEEAGRQQAELECLREQVGRLSAEAEVARLRRELEYLRRFG
jgi:Putative restriction endonuclease